MNNCMLTKCPSCTEGQYPSPKEGGKKPLLSSAPDKLTHSGTIRDLVLNCLGTGILGTFLSLGDLNNSVEDFTDSCSESSGDSAVLSFNWPCLISCLKEHTNKKNSAAGNFKHKVCSFWHHE